MWTKILRIKFIHQRIIIFNLFIHIDFVTFVIANTNLLFPNISVFYNQDIGLKHWSPLEYNNFQCGSLNTTRELIRDLKNIDIVFHIGDICYANGY